MCVYIYSLPREGLLLDALRRRETETERGRGMERERDVTTPSPWLYRASLPDKRNNARKNQRENEREGRH